MQKRCRASEKHECRRNDVRDPSSEKDPVAGAASRKARIHPDVIDCHQDHGDPADEIYRLDARGLVFDFVVHWPLPSLCIECQSSHSADHIALGQPRDDQTISGRFVRRSERSAGKSSDGFGDMLAASTTQW
jgi:hypothetical protein